MDDDHGDLIGRSKPVFALTIITFALATIFVGLRLLSRGMIVKRISIDDYFIILAWILAFGLAFCCCYGTWWGLGRHEIDIPAGWQLSLREANYAFSILYQPSLMAIKTSILAFYITLPTQQRIFKWAIWATLFAVNVGGLALTLVTVFQCRPIAAAWAAMMPSSAQCTDIVTIYLSSAPLNIITDLAILFLPMPVLTSMRLPRKTKIILIITFSFGIFVAAVDVVRVAYLQSAATTRLSMVQDENQRRSVGSTARSTLAQEAMDYSYTVSFSFMWSVIEVNVGMAVACVPGLKPLVARFIPHMLRDEGEMTSRSQPETLAKPTEDRSHVINDKTQPPLPGNVCHRDLGAHGDDQPGEAEQGESRIGMMDFLTTPEMTSLSEVLRTQTDVTDASHMANAGESTFFDFVNMDAKKSLVQLTHRESIFPIAAVTVLFFIWGFEYGLLDVLNQQFQIAGHMTPGQGIALHSAYWAGYFFGPVVVGLPVLKQWGFKAAYTVGLSIYGCGTLIYWPAAVLTSFPAFVVTNFIVAFGLSILEVSANPFIALCGPPGFGAVRLNISQGVQAIGSIIAPLIAYRAFAPKAVDASSLVGTQWAYLGISLATILLAVAFYYIPLPEATEEELEEATERSFGSLHTSEVVGISWKWVALAIGALSTFLYVGGQQVVATSFEPFLLDLAPDYDVSNLLAIAHTAFAVSRFFAAGLGLWIGPHVLMLVFWTGAIVFAALAMHFTGTLGMAMLIMVFFMEGPLFSLIYAEAVVGLGRHTKLGSALLACMIGGGAVFAPISGELALSGVGVGFSLVVAVATFACGGALTVVWICAPSLSRQSHSIHAVTTPPERRPSSVKSDIGHALNLWGVYERDDHLGTEHRERRKNSSLDHSPDHSYQH